jgi:hypothetical protein
LEKQRGHESCKVLNMSYDRIVCAMLSMAKHHAPGLSVYSDAWMGDERDRWPEAAAWATRVLGRRIEPPVTYLKMPVRRRIRVFAIRMGWMP